MQISDSRLSRVPGPPMNIIEIEVYIGSTAGMGLPLGTTEGKKEKTTYQHSNLQERKSGSWAFQKDLKKRYYLSHLQYYYQQKGGKEQCGGDIRS